jgi:hypothetical protein
VFSFVRNPQNLSGSVSLSPAQDICILKDRKSSIRRDVTRPAIHRQEKDGLNKTDLINEVAKVTATKKEAQAAVECVFDTITTRRKIRIR